MSKGGVIVLIIAAIVFTGLGFVIGNVVTAAGSNPGSREDPVMTQSGVEKMLSERISELKSDVDRLTALVDSASGVNGGEGQTGTDDPLGPEGNGSASEKKVKVTSESVNVRSSASTSASIVGSVSSGTVLTYLDSKEGSDGTWYHVKLSNGTEGYVASWLCGEPY